MIVYLPSCVMRNEITKTKPNQAKTIKQKTTTATKTIEIRTITVEMDREIKKLTYGETDTTTCR